MSESSVMLIDIEAGTALSEMVNFGGFETAMVFVPGSWTTANLGLKVSDTKLGTYSILRDEVGVPVQITNILASGARWYSLPADVYPAKYFKLWSKSTVAATETDVNQISLRELKILLKA